MEKRRATERIRVQDYEARDFSQKIFDIPLVLEAGAGTGKTAALTSRIIAWCLGPGWKRAEDTLGETHKPAELIQLLEAERVAAHVLDGVVAITFTESAAAEMATRVGESLAQIEHGALPQGISPESLPPSPGQRRIRSRALLCVLDHLMVGTIHSFCLRLLSEHPLEARLHPDLIVDADGFILEEFVREAVEDQLKTAYSNQGNPHFLALAAAGVGPQDIADALTTLAEAAIPEEVLEEDPFVPQRVRQAQAALLNALIALKEMEGDRLLNVGKRSPSTRHLLEKIDATLRPIKDWEGRHIADIGALCALIQTIWSEEDLERLKQWEASKFKQSERRCLGDLVEEFAHRAGILRSLIQHVGCVDPRYMNHARFAIGPLLSKVYSKLQARGALTFNALLRHARDLLADHPQVRETVRRRINQLLVDEFQDTDPLQCEIIGMIALDGPQEDRPGLFLVGDPKQSIYGWRNANLQAYDDFIARIRKEGGKRYRLAVNFRSAPPILQEVERVISPVMVHREGLQPAFEPLIPCATLAKAQGFRKKHRAPIEYWISWAWDREGQTCRQNTRSSDAVELEAQMLARDILSLHRDEEVPWQDIGVLFRSTGDMDRYLTSFRETGIPYVVTRDKGYYRRREIIDAAALVRCVLEPNDHLALLTLIRSPIVGVPDAALIPLWSESFPALITEIRGLHHEQITRLQELIRKAASHLPADIPGLERIQGWEENLCAAATNLAVLRESFHRDPFDTFVERMRTLFLIEVTEAARYLGAFRLANLERFFQGLLEAMEESGGDTQRVLRALRTGIAQMREAEEGRPKEATENAVQVLTIHKAKGLDFKHLYVMQLNKGSRSDDRPSTAVSLSDGLFEYTLFGVPTLGFADVRGKQIAVEGAELVRTLYVAMTRAKDRLVLAGNWPTEKAKWDTREARTHMNLLQWRNPKPPSLSELLPRIEKDPHGSYADAAEARWIFPGLLTRNDVELRSRKTKSGLPLPERVTQEAEKLSQRKQFARARMARPFHSAASEESHEALQALFAEQGLHKNSSSHTWVVGLKTPSSDRRQHMAMAVGTVLHRVLESLDLEGDPERECQIQRQCLRGLLNQLVAPDLLEDALRKTRSLFDRFATGPLLQKLRTIHPYIVARELPILIPPTKESTGPVGFIAGTIDLLYRDSLTGGLVVADYKTDEVQTELEIASRTRAYAPQGAIYVRAVKEALGQSEDPMFELWFIHANHIEMIR